MFSPSLSLSGKHIEMKIINIHNKVFSKIRGGTPLHRKKAILNSQVQNAVE